MTNESLHNEPESLGQFLHKTRIAQGVELDQVGEETKISITKLKAMESDDFGALPVDVFARGFYGIYAKTLNLDPNEIVARFLAERGPTLRKEGAIPNTTPPHKAAQEVSNMAEPSSVSPMSTVGLALLLLIILGGGICWYFNVNPATYISEKIRGVQDIDPSEEIQIDPKSGTQQPARSSDSTTIETSAISQPSMPITVYEANIYSGYIPVCLTS
jgi:cytoskeletal protein RodZ